MRSRSAWLEKTVGEEAGAGLSFDRRIRRPALDGGGEGSAIVRWAEALPAGADYRDLEDRLRAQNRREDPLVLAPQVQTVAASPATNRTQRTGKSASSAGPRATGLAYAAHN
jgi:hypothetical protein